MIIMLGTNDLKPHLGRTALEASYGMRRLVQIVRAHSAATGTPQPAIVIVAPPHLSKTNVHPEMMDHFGQDAAIEQSKLSRVRRPGELPEEALAECLRLAGTRPDSVNCVAIVRPLAAGPEAKIHLELRSRYPNSHFVLVEHQAAHAVRVVQCEVQHGRAAQRHSFRTAGLLRGRQGLLVAVGSGGGGRRRARIRRAPESPQLEAGTRAG